MTALEQPYSVYIAVRQAEELVARILATGTPADRLLDRHFREHSQLGGRDRAVITETVYGVVRHQRLLQALAPDQGVAGLVKVALLRFLGWSVTELQAAFGETALEGLTLESATAESVELPPALRWSLPDWLWQRFEQRFSRVEAEQLAQALSLPAFVDLRVNGQRSSREQVLQQLAGVDIPASAAPFAPGAVRLTRRIAAGQLALHKSGVVEIQDEGSQLIALLVAPRPGELVVDLCAGAGGKSLHLADLMGNKGRIIAADTDGRRLERIKPRAWRGAAECIHLLTIRHERDRKLGPWLNKADRVLVDAPCSGSGTLRRNPEIKWRLTSVQVDNFHQRQCALLAAGAALVRPGGYLVYATCSLLMRENQEVVTAFLKEHNGFRLLPAHYTLEQQGVTGLNLDTPYLELFPHRHGTDGFFAALLQRRK